MLYPMKTSLQRTLLTMVGLSALAPLALAQTSILIDFGKIDFESSAETDPNGYHWNNVSADHTVASGLLDFAMLSEARQQDILANGPPVPFYNDRLPITILGDLVDQNGDATGVGLVLSDFIDIRDDLPGGGMGIAGLDNGDDLGPLPTDTGWPGTATRDSMYVNFEHEGVFSITGLNDANTYTLRMWGGQPRDSRPASWIINGDTAGEQTIETLNNTGANAEDYALFENVSPSGGVITVKYEQGTEDALNPNGQWSVMEIVGVFDGGGNDWYGFSVDENGWVNTGDWIGWVNVIYDPWIWSTSLDKYVTITDDSGWVFVPKN